MKEEAAQLEMETLSLMCYGSAQRATAPAVVVVVVPVAIVVVMARKIPINAKYSISFHYAQQSAHTLSPSL